MATIDFQLFNETSTSMKPALWDLTSGSGLGFFGATAGSSVQIGAYQGRTDVTNADGSDIEDSTNNIKYVADTFPSGMTSTSLTGGAVSTVGLSGIKSNQATLGINFSHDTEVNVQNCQLRVYDRVNTNYPASGVNTRVAEIINHNGSAAVTSGLGSAGNTSAAVGSGDAFWWGEPWPSDLVGAKNSFVNSQGVTFYNGTDDELNDVNGDIRLGQVGGDRASVGGTGIIVPLADSPGSGGRGLNRAEIKTPGATIPGQIWPKWTQYIEDAGQNTMFGYTQGTGSTNTGKTFGGTGVDTHHTWAVALSASPLNIGSKEKYGLYVSLEYL